MKSLVIYLTFLISLFFVLFISCRFFENEQNNIFDFSLSKQVITDVKLTDSLSFVTFFFNKENDFLYKYSNIHIEEIHYIPNIVVDFCNKNKIYFDYEKIEKSFIDEYFNSYILEEPLLENLIIDFIINSEEAFDDLDEIINNVANSLKKLFKYNNKRIHISEVTVYFYRYNSVERCLYLNTLN